MSVVPIGDPVVQDFRTFFADIVAVSEPISLPAIGKYESFYQHQAAARKGVQQKPYPKHSDFNYKNLLEWLNHYKKSVNIDAAFALKQRKYGEALQVLDKIANARSLTRSQFIPLFEKLVGSKTEDNLWHSGSIYRKKTKVFNQPLAFQELVRFISVIKTKNRHSFLTVPSSLLTLSMVPGSILSPK